MTLNLIIKGRPASKKNSRRIYSNSRGGITNLPSDSYAKFHSDAMTQIANLKIKFTGPVKIVYLFRRKGNYSQDVDNAICSINDILQDAGIIDDDKNIISGTFNVVQNNPEWSTLITIDSLDTDLAKR